MNASTIATVSPISTYFRVCDGVRVRFADNRADSDITMLLLAPWPESSGPSVASGTAFPQSRG
jgi:hypothetical protein